MNIFKQLRYSKTDENGKKMTIRELAKEIGVAGSHICELENENKSPSFNEIKRYHDYFNVPYEDLLGEIRAFDGIIADKQDVKYSMEIIQKADTSEDILLKQTVEVLFGTEPGKVLLFQLAELLFGVKNEDIEDGAYCKDKEYEELHVITHESIEKKAQQFINKLLLIRDPKYRNLSYNELNLVIDNVKDVDSLDEYSKKCVFE